MSNILVVVKETRLSGSVKIALESSSQFYQKVDVLTMGFKDDHNDNSILRSYNFIENIFFGCGVLGLVKFIIKNHRKYELIYSHSSINGFVVRLLKLFLRYNVIHVVHGVAWHSKANILVRIVTYLIDYMLAFFLTDTLILVNSHYSKFFYGCRNIKIIWNYADIKLTKTQNKISKSIVFVGRLDNQKRPLLFLKIIEENMSLIRSQDWTVSIFGDGELKDRCEKYVVENNLESIVTFYGWTDWRNEYEFKDCIHCVTSGWEAFGLNIVEAGFINIPSIAFDVEGLSQVISDGETGLLFKTKSKFNKGLKEIIVNSNLRYNLGNNARKIYRVKFSKQVFLNEYYKVFQSYRSNQIIS